MAISRPRGCKALSLRESRWDREDRQISLLRRWSAFLSYGLASVFLMIAAASACAVMIETGVIAQAAWMQGHLSRDWPMCLQDWRSNDTLSIKPFEPARVPI